MPIHYTFDELSNPPKGIDEMASRQVYQIAGLISYHTPVLRDIIRTQAFEKTQLSATLETFKHIESQIDTSELSEPPSHIMGLSLGEAFKERVDNSVSLIEPITGVSFPERTDLAAQYQFEPIATVTSDKAGLGIYHLSDRIQQMDNLILFPPPEMLDEFAIQTPLSEWSEQTAIEFIDQYYQLLVMATMGEAQYPVGDGSKSDRDRLISLSNIIHKYSRNAHIIYGRRGKPYTPLLD